MNLHYHDDNLLYSVTNLFAAGTDTTATTLKWCILYMAKFPHIQGTETQFQAHFIDFILKLLIMHPLPLNLFLIFYLERVQEELSRVIGSRQVQTEDRKNLPYTDAVIHESQRFANIVPMALPHTISTDIIFQGYFIKEVSCLVFYSNTYFLFCIISFYILCYRFKALLINFLNYREQLCFLFLLLSSMMRRSGRIPTASTLLISWTVLGCSLGEMPSCPFLLVRLLILLELWCFIPLFHNLRQLLAGRRACLGESLARMELFLFFTSLLQHFRFTPPPGVSEDQLDLTPVVGITLAPKPQQLCAIRRH